MPHPVLETDECIGCGICVDACPQGVLEIAGGVVVLETKMPASLAATALKQSHGLHHRESSKTNSAAIS